MKAPEKIYIREEITSKGEVLNGRTWHSKDDEFYRESDAEYVRTDAFIENAEKYLENQFIKNVSVLCSGVVSINFSTAIKNFVKYMKG